MVINSGFHNFDSFLADVETDVLGFFAFCHRCFIFGILRPIGLSKNLVAHLLTSVGLSGCKVPQ